MTLGRISPLALTAGAGFYNNQGIGINAEFSDRKIEYESTTLIGNLLITLDLAQGSLPPGTGNATSLSANTRARLRTIGANVSGNYLPALGDSIPSNISVTIGNATINNGNITGNVPAGIDFNQGMIGLVSNVAILTLGDGNFSRFAQAFAAAQGYVALTNQMINSADRANQYLGPTFEGMDALITGDVARINLALSAFGEDLRDLGDTYALDQIGQFGTPAGLLAQLSTKGNMLNGTLPSIRTALLAQGLSDEDISDLVNLNFQDLFNSQGLSQNEFDSLQKRAYPALCTITGDDLVSVLEILEVSTPNLTSMCDLLNPVKIFPRSYPSLTVPTPAGDVLIYNEDGTVNQDIVPILESAAPIPRGCNDLAKIIPPDQALANQALQIGFAQIKNVLGTSLPELAAAVR